MVCLVNLRIVHIIFILIEIPYTDKPTKIPFNQVQADDCFQAGKCANGYLLHVQSTTDEYDCLDACNDYDGSNWLTYQPQVSECRLFYNCSAVDPSGCQECLTAKRGNTNLMNIV